METLFGHFHHMHRAMPFPHQPCARLQALASSVLQPISEIGGFVVWEPRAGRRVDAYVLTADASTSTLPDRFKNSRNRMQSTAVERAVSEILDV